MAFDFLTGYIGSLEKLCAVVQARERFHPFPTIEERETWEKIPADARSALLQAGEAQLVRGWELLTSALFLEYKRTGNRSHYEKAWNRRREKLKQLVIAECIEGEGRFTDEIATGVWLVCEESFWGFPAHLGAQKTGIGLPDVTEPIVDLFAAETANLLAWTFYLLSSRLERLSPLIPERIHFEIDRRILLPCLARDDFSWMGVDGQRVNNWCTWISSNWLAAALILDRDERRRLAAVNKILGCLNNFLNCYYADGGCDEGPSYWDRAGGSLFDCLELLYAASDGALNAFDIPLVREIGRYIVRVHIHDEWYANVADGSARLNVNGDLLYRFGKRVGDEQMMALGAFAAHDREKRGILDGSIGRVLPAIFNLDELRKAPRSQPLLRDVWLPGIQLMAARVKEGSPEGLYLAAKGGNNAESHNHNDVGNFIVYLEGLPALIDVGVETYTARHFSPERYEIWTMQSAYHNCPTIDGVIQAAGPQFAASEVSYHTDDHSAEVQLNLGLAYPTEANLRSWKRLLRLNRTKNEIELIDDYVLSRPAKFITLTFMTPCCAPQVIPGTIRLSVSPKDTVSIFFDSCIFTPVLEELRLDDQRMRYVWGERIYRIMLRADDPALEAKWRFQITS